MTPLRLLLAVPYLLFALPLPLPVAVLLAGVASAGFGAGVLLQERLIALTPERIRGQALGTPGSVSAADHYGFVAQQVVSDKGKVVKKFEGEGLGQAIPEQVAGDLRDMMLRVVESGTGSFARIPGLQVAGKTGTAQHASGKPPHAWFIGFTSSGDKSIAVAVVVENGGDVGSEATGGHVAAPIAKRVMQAYLGGG